MRFQKQSIALNLALVLVLMAALFLPAIALAQDSECYDDDGNVIECPATDDGTGDDTGDTGDTGDTCTDEEGSVIDCPPDEYTACYDDEGNVIDCPTDEDTDEDSGDDSTEKRVPPGQMVRRGLSGPIVGVGDGYILIETNFGVVKVTVDAEVDESMVGQRVAVKLAKTEGGASGYAPGRTSDTTGDDTTGDDTTGDDTTGDDTGNDAEPEFYREAVAEQFKLIPTKATKQHRWGTIELNEEGEPVIVDEEGNETSVDCETEECLGEDVVAVTNDEGSDDEGDDTPTLLTSRIRDRITARLEQAEADGDTKVRDRLQDQLERYDEKQTERQDRAEERAAIRAEKVNSQGNGNQNNDRGNSNNQGRGNSGNSNAGGKNK